MKKLTLFLLVCLLATFSFQGFAQFECPDFEYCLEQPDPNVPTYVVMLDFNGTLTDIWGFNLEVQIKNTYPMPGDIINTLTAGMIPANMQNFGLTTTIASDGRVKLQEFFINPLMTLSGAPIELLTFSFTGDVGECFTASILGKTILFDSGTDGIKYCAGTVCPSSANGLDYCFSGINISGTIESTPPLQCTGSIDHGIPQVETLVNSVAGAPCISYTDNAGDYDCDALPNSSIFITPTKSDNPTCGITTTDVIQLNTFLLYGNLGNAFQQWSQVIAGDINENNVVSTFDVILLQKIILGLPVNYNSWRFTPSKIYGALGAIPLSTQLPYLPYRIFLQTPMTNEANQDFVGFKIGDVNLSCTDCSGSQMGARSSFASEETVESLIQINDCAKEKGDEFLLPVIAHHSNPFIAYGLGLRLNTDYLEILEVIKGDFEELNVKDDFNLRVLSKGEIKHLWLGKGMGAATVSKGEVLFYIRLKAKKDFISMSELIKIEDGLVENIIQTTDGETMPYGLKIAQSNAFSPKVFPNPFQESVAIKFNLPGAAIVDLSIFDSAGRLILQQNQSFDKGINIWELTHKDIHSAGLLIYHLKTKDYFYSGKMLKLK